MSGSEHQEPLADALRQAAERTRQERTARIHHEMTFAFENVDRAAEWRRVRRGRLRRVLSWGTRRILGFLSSRVRVKADGVIDFELRRVLTDFGRAQLLEAGDHRFVWRRGRWGQDGRAGAAGQPSWLFDLLAGVVDARKLGQDEVRGVSCRRYDAKVDLARASAASPYGLAVPQVDRYEDLSNLPLEVWLDGQGRVRRLRFSAEPLGTTLELFDFGRPTSPQGPSAASARPSPEA